MLEKEFGRLGLNDNEREVYLAVLKAGKASPARIAKETAINRTTVYSVSRKLMSLGLIGEDLSAKVGYLYAEKPEALEHMFAKEEALLKERREVAQVVAKELAALPSGKSYSVPRIKFIEEADLSEYLYKQYVLWGASGAKRDNTWWGYIDSSFTKEYKEWIHWTWKHGPKGQKVNFFANESEIEQKVSLEHPDRITRPLPEGQEFDSSFWVIGDYVLMAQSRERPHYLVEIHDAVFARNQRQLFKNLWGVGK
jgi:predicted transcriptional regulator